ncbi:unnamed protein product [Durusdinium trenchii]|uniref:Uncharacterized protein n=1 Tax=Durusdinium trenchii TaxID=1381693 RepID=A0ABP0SZT6_9DINO
MAKSVTPVAPTRRHRSKSAPRGVSPDPKALRKASEKKAQPRRLQDVDLYTTPPPRTSKRSTSTGSKDSVRQRISFGENTIHDIEAENKSKQPSKGKVKSMGDKEAEKIFEALKDQSYGEDKVEARRKWWSRFERPGMFTKAPGIPRALMLKLKRSRRISKKTIRQMQNWWKSRLSKMQEEKNGEDSEDEGKDDESENEEPEDEAASSASEADDKEEEEDEQDEDEESETAEEEEEEEKPKKTAKKTGKKEPKESGKAKTLAKVEKKTEKESAKGKDKKSETKGKKKEEKEKVKVNGILKKNSPPPSEPSDGGSADESGEDKKGKSNSKAKRSSKTKEKERKDKAASKEKAVKASEAADGKRKKNTKGSDSEAPGKKKKSDEDDGKPLKEAEEGLVNSTSNRKEWQQFTRWVRNKKRCPAKIDTRQQLFKDFVDTGDFAKVEARFEQRLEETQRTSVKYGFRSEETVPDPELPGEGELLYFVMVEMNIEDIKELRRITQLEMEGTLDADGLKAFVEAGGCLDGKQHLALGNMVGADGMAKLVVKAKDALEKAQTLVNKVESITKVAKGRIDLAKALIRASEKKPKAKAEPKTTSGAAKGTEAAAA